ncbi:hypothetical protein DUI87_16908 [Hirundo rustica rustica]|uniref:Uncharacterized protein n=1 Tax=Hirundo rustica rustica TaxID=333673 RepID=A0A3M0K2A6_HIRRU|nr:hypothetical protein DUI87_16908 [Hirundo rustica rustica]
MVVVVGRDPPRSSGPNPCSKLGQRKQVGKGHIRLGFKYLKEGDSETSPCNLYCAKEDSHSKMTLNYIIFFTLFLLRLPTCFHYSKDFAARNQVRINDIKRKMAQKESKKVAEDANFWEALVMKNNFEAINKGYGLKKHNLKLAFSKLRFAGGKATVDFLNGQEHFSWKRRLKSPNKFMSEYSSNGEKYIQILQCILINATTSPSTSLVHLVLENMVRFHNIDFLSKSPVEESSICLLILFIQTETKLSILCKVSCVWGEHDMLMGPRGDKWVSDVNKLSKDKSDPTSFFLIRILTEEIQMLLSGTRAEISFQPVVKIMVMQAIPLKHMEDHAGAHGKPQSGVAGCVLKEAAAMEISHWNRVLVGTAVCGEKPIQEQVFQQDL